ncbi:hypothetical protein AAFF_G00310470 [Aldrovandia affinis]|uniref:Disks large-associated protein 5 n=1 Tax=Aldrovandia affinis TaxID=143900 RepID=A0AAD7W0S5_9TELE|nr:hypothetical protein AAFF_G00310470 [Aldrovandia affinis]
MCTLELYGNKEKFNVRKMESRFSHLSQRDNSVPMLRVKMSRRRSQAQKENRDRAVSRHRGLNQLPELEKPGLEVAVVGHLKDANHGPKLGKKGSVAVEERKKMLVRYKEAKELQKEKERRAIQKRGIFKVGLYKPEPLASLPQAPAKTKPLALRENVSLPRKVEPLVKPTKPFVRQKPVPAPPAVRWKTAPVEATTRVQETRAAKEPQRAPLPSRGKPAPAEVPKTRATSKQAAVLPRSRAQTDILTGNTQSKSQAIEHEPAEVEKSKECMLEIQENSPPNSADPHPEGEDELLKEEKMEAKTSLSPSFAPQGFLFEPPVGLNSFLPTALGALSTDAFLAPSSSRANTPSAVVLDAPVDPPPCAESMCPSPPPPQPLESPSGPKEPQHDVPYFRAAMASETDRLAGLCEQWDSRFEEPSIPEEMRERVRTTVGQARLLMRERFGQFEGLVDDCALGRGEKLTTCTDLQGFWDMVYYQVEDVIRKFNALKEAESRGWQEEHKPLPRIKRTAKKPPSVAATGKAVARGEAGAAARSRLAAVKAAMKVKLAAEAQSAVESPAREALPKPLVLADILTTQTVVFHGGFFQVESPAKVTGSMRLSSRLGAAPSPCPPSKCTTPSRLLPTAASRPSPAPGLALTPVCQTNTTPFLSLIHTPNPQSSYTEAIDHSEGPVKDLQPTLPRVRSPPAGQLDLERAQSDTPPCLLEPAAEQSEADSQPTPLTQTPKDATGQSGIRQVYLELEPLLHLTKAHSQSELVLEVTDASPDQSELVTGPLTESSPPAHTATLTPSQPVRAVEDASWSLSCQRADYSPSEWQGLNFTLSPCPSTPTQGLLLSPCDSSPIVCPLSHQSPPSTSMSCSLPLMYLTPCCVTDSSLVAADGQMGTAAEMSYTEDFPRLDVDRYIQTSSREPITMETSPSPTVRVATDVQMESPRPELDDQLAAEVQHEDSALHSGAEGESA